jgi:hypothetical protein
VRAASLTLLCTSFALWILALALAPHLGPKLLATIHFEHPDHEHRARALTIRDAHLAENR